MARFRKFRSAQALSTALGQFISIANSNLATLTSLTAGDITALTALKTDIDAKIAAEVAARAAAKTATQAKNDSLATRTGFEAKVLKVFAQGGVPDTLPCGSVWT